MTRTEIMLLLMTDGRPTLNVEEICGLLNVQRPSLMNRIYANKLPFAVFQIEGSAEWCAHVSDVAAHIDQQREEASKIVDGERVAPRVRPKRKERT